jgi:hypothetical protein
VRFLPPAATGLYFSGVTLTRVMVVAGIAAAAVGGYVHVAFSAAPTGPPRGVVANCSTASFADFPGAFTNPRNLVVGPLVMTGARGNAGWASVFHGNKFPLLVRNGHRITLELSARTRRFAGLAYGPLPQGETQLRDTHRVVRFIACPANRDSGSTADAEAVTFWSGGIVSLAPGCVPLRIWIDSERSPRRAVIRLGVQRCS